MFYNSQSVLNSLTVCFNLLHIFINVIFLLATEESYEHSNIPAKHESASRTDKG